MRRSPFLISLSHSCLFGSVELVPGSCEFVVDYVAEVCEVAEPFSQHVKDADVVWPAVSLRS